MGDLTIRVGGNLSGSRPGKMLHHIGWYEPTEMVHRYPYGCWSLGFRMDLNGERPRELTGRLIVEGWWGGLRIWRGFMDEPDWDSGTFSASGLCRQAETAYAVDGAGLATTDPAVAVASAMASGAVSWSGPVVWGPGRKALPEATEMQRLDAVLNSWCLLNGVRWLVDADGHLQIVTDPTMPTAFISPSAGDLGVSSEYLVTHIRGGYKTLSMGYAADVTVGGSIDGLRLEELADLSEMGVLSQADAQATINAIYAQAGGGQPRFTNAISVGQGDVTARRGPARNHASLRAGEMYRVLGMTDPRNGEIATDVVMEETSWDCREDGHVRLTPLNAVRSDYASIVEQAIGGSQ